MFHNNKNLVNLFRFFISSWESLIGEKEWLRNNAKQLNVVLKVDRQSVEMSNLLIKQEAGVSAAGSGP